MEGFKNAFLRNRHIYYTFHFHITFNKSVDLGILKTNCIILPIDDTYNVYKQNQTSIKISSNNIATFNDLCSLCETLKDDIIGYKLEGVVLKHTPLKNKINDFVYYEYHEKFDGFPKKIDDVLYSFSEKNNQIYSAKRYYNKYEILEYNKYEICVYDYQLIPFEKDWIINKKNNIKCLKNYMLKNNIVI